MPSRSHLALVTNSDHPDLVGYSTSSTLRSNNGKTSQRLANVLETGLATIGNTSTLLDAAERELTKGGAAMARDYARIHSFAAAATAAYEADHPDSPYDIRPPLADILSDTVNAYRRVFGAAAEEMTAAIRYGSRLEPDERNWLLKQLAPVPEDE